MKIEKRIYRIDTKDFDRHLQTLQAGLRPQERIVSTQIVGESLVIFTEEEMSEADDRPKNLLLEELKKNA